MKTYSRFTPSFSHGASDPGIGAERMGATIHELP